MQEPQGQARCPVFQLTGPPAEHLEGHRTLSPHPRLSSWFLSSQHHCWLLESAPETYCHHWCPWVPRPDSLPGSCSSRLAAEAVLGQPRLCPALLSVALETVIRGMAELGPQDSGTEPGADTHRPKCPWSLNTQCMWCGQTQERRIMNSWFQLCRGLHRLVPCLGQFLAGSHGGNPHGDLVAISSEVSLPPRQEEHLLQRVQPGMALS